MGDLELEAELVHVQVRLAGQLQQSGLQPQELAAMMALRAKPPDDASAEVGPGVSGLGLYFS